MNQVSKLTYRVIFIYHYFNHCDYDLYYHIINLLFFKSLKTSISLVRNNLERKQNIEYIVKIIVNRLP